MVVPRLGFSFEFAVVEQISNRKPAAFRSTKTGSCLARTRWTIRNLDAREIGHLRFHVAEPAVGVVLNGVLIFSSFFFVPSGGSLGSADCSRTRCGAFPDALGFPDALAFCAALRCCGRELVISVALAPSAASFPMTCE